MHSGAGVTHWRGGSGVFHLPEPLPFDFLFSRTISGAEVRMSVESPFTGNGARQSAERAGNALAYINSYTTDTFTHIFIFLIILLFNPFTAHLCEL